MRAIKLATVFVCCMGVCALVAWLGGFNFDRRDFLVGYGFLVALVFSISVTAFVAVNTEGAKE